MVQVARLRERAGRLTATEGDQPDLVDLFARLEREEFGRVLEPDERPFDRNVADLIDTLEPSVHEPKR